jgi:phage-related baseplate assembly protein
MASSTIISTLPPPIFVTDSDGLDPNATLTDMIAMFQTVANRVLQPAQVERLLVNLYAYRESLVRNAIQYAGQQNLLAFAEFPVLDYIGQLMNTPRLGAVGAGTTLQWTLVAALAQAFTIIAGTQVGTKDGQFVFTTTQDLTISAGSTVGTVSAQCTTRGTGGNGYIPGQVSILIQADTLVASVTNTTTTADGALAESSDDYRARIQIAPNQYTTAGPTSSYEYLARSSSPSIIDAAISTPNPGQVQITVLTGPITAQPATSPNTAGIATSTVLNAVLATCSAKTVRPLNDTVSAVAVTEVDYQVAATVYVYSDADEDSTMTAANTAAVNQALVLANRIERDLVPSQWETALSVSGVYDVDVAITATINGVPISPTADGRIVLVPGQWTNCTALTLTPVVAAESS